MDAKVEKIGCSILNWSFYLGSAAMGLHLLRNRDPNLSQTGDGQMTDLVVTLACRCLALRFDYSTVLAKLMAGN